MYLPTSPGQALGGADCSRWETDPQSFSKVVAEHYLRTVPGSRTVLGLSLKAKRIAPHGSSRWIWVVWFPNDIVVYVSFEKVPDFVAAARWYPKPAGPSRFYTYSCTPAGQLVLSERKRP